MRDRCAPATAPSSISRNSKRAPPSALPASETDSSCTWAIRLTIVSPTPLPPYPVE
nr:hypothetical protein [Natronomonas salsuginis]